MKINSDTNTTLQQPDAVQRLAAMGFEPQNAGVDEFTKYFHDEVLKWRKVIDDAGIAAN
jgi:tripartite-type tricarboxylate transporter receptor subunit TctC